MIEGKLILVTGASSGIGYQVVKQAVEEGYQVIAVARRVEQIYSHPRVHSKQLDLQDEKAMLGFVDEIGILHGLVHVAGMLEQRPLKVLTKASLNNTIEINTVAPIVLTQLLSKKKKIAKGSSIVFISSINGNRIGNIACTAYATSKAALTGAAKVMALELAPKQIRVNSILPGIVKTEMVESLEVNISSEALAEDLKKYPLGRFGTPEDIANATLFLLGDKSTWITGSELVIDGGFTLN